MAELEFCCQLNPGEETCDCQTESAVKVRHSPVHICFPSLTKESPNANGEGGQGSIQQCGYHEGDVGCFLPPGAASTFTGKVSCSSKQHAASSSDTARANLTLSTEPSRGFVLPCTVPEETLPLTSPIPLPLRGSRKVSGAGCPGRDAHNSREHNPTLRYTNSLLLLSGEDCFVVVILYCLFLCSLWKPSISWGELECPLFLLKRKEDPVGSK